MNMKKYTVVDLFAGAGGMSLGFEQSNGFEIIAAIESGTMPAGGNELKGATVQLLYQWMEDGLRP